MKQDWRQIASILNTGEVSLYQYNEDGSVISDPVAKLSGLEEEGFGLSWSPNKQGLLTAATGTSICLWDVNSIGVKGSPFLKIESAHQKVINDVKFSNINENLFGTASDDSNYKIWDLRSAKDTNSFIHCYKASEDDLLVISFNQFNEHLFATAGEESGLINIWDLRMAKTSINDLHYHKTPVTQIEWSPSSEYLFMSSASDGEIFVWDQNNCGEE